jgi:hypothetical protein
MRVVLAAESDPYFCLKPLEDLRESYIAEETDNAQFITEFLDTLLVNDGNPHFGYDGSLEYIARLKAHFAAEDKIANKEYELANVGVQTGIDALDEEMDMLGKRIFGKSKWPEVKSLLSDVENRFGFEFAEEFFFNDVLSKGRNNLVHKGRDLWEIYSMHSDARADMVKVEMSQQDIGRKLNDLEDFLTVADDLIERYNRRQAILLAIGDSIATPEGDHDNNLYFKGPFYSVLDPEQRKVTGPKP